MDTDSHTTEKPVFDAEVRARVPQWMADGLDVVAARRLLDRPDILREAVREYLDRRKAEPTAKETIPA